MITFFYKYKRTVMAIASLLAVHCSLLTTLSSCSSDHDADSNPQITTPQDFTLNTPSYAAFPVDLTRTDSMTITWSQPQYTADIVPLQLRYEILTSLTDKYDVALDSADNDMSGTLKADYAAMARTTTKCSYSILTEELDSLINRLANYKTAADVPGNLPVFLRVNAYIDENSTRMHEKQSNSVQIQTIPFYKEIKFLDPISWYLVGYGIGNNAGGWGGTTIGKDMIPTFLIPGEKYNKVKGTGVTEYTGYFYQGQKFRFILGPNNWDTKHGYEQLKEQDDPTYYSFVEEGTDNNFVVKTAGYYTVTVNTSTSVIDMAPYTDPVTKYSSLTTQGTVNGSTTAVMMDPVNINGNSTVEDATDPLQSVENHLWSCTVKGGDAFKILSGGKTWGYVNGLKASTDGNGNIVIPDGTYLFLFNDINGSYMLIKQ